MMCCMGREMGILILGSNPNDIVDNLSMMHKIFPLSTPPLPPNKILVLVRTLLGVLIEQRNIHTYVNSL